MNVRSIHALLLPLGLLVLAGSGCATWLRSEPPQAAPVENVDTRQALVDGFEKHRIQAEYQAARMQLEMGNLEVAEANLNSLLAKHPGHRAARRLLAELYAATERPDAALGTLDLLLNDDPSDDAAHHLRAMVLADLNRTEAARYSLNRALELEPGNALYRASFEALFGPVPVAAAASGS